jgi:hypothetical protein
MRKVRFRSAVCTALFTFITVVLSVSAGSASAFEITVTTSFESFQTAPFTVGTLPISLEIMAGETKTIGNINFYHSGTFSWHIRPVDSPATAVFETDASALSFWVRTTDPSITSLVRVFDEDNAVIYDQPAPDAFMQVSLVRAMGETLIRSFEITNDGGTGGAFDVVVDDLSFTATIIPIPPAVWLFGSALGLLGWMRRRRKA